MNKQSMNKYIRLVAQSFINHKKEQRRKNWIAVSLSLLMSMGLGAITPHSVHAANGNNISTKPKVTAITSSGNNTPTSKATTSISNNQSSVSSSVSIQSSNNVIHSSFTTPISSSSNMQSVSNSSTLSENSRTNLLNNSQSNTSTYNSQVLSIKSNAVASAISDYNNNYSSSNVLTHSSASTNVNTINQQAKAVASGVISHLQADNTNSLTSQTYRKPLLGASPDIDYYNLELIDENTGSNMGDDQVSGESGTTSYSATIPSGYHAVSLPSIMFHDSPDPVSEQFSNIYIISDASSNSSSSPNSFTPLPIPTPTTPTSNSSSSTSGFNIEVNYVSQNDTSQVLAHYPAYATYTGENLGDAGFNIANGVPSGYYLLNSSEGINDTMTPGISDEIEVTNVSPSASSSYIPPSSESNLAPTSSSSSNTTSSSTSTTTSDTVNYQYNGNTVGVHTIISTTGTSAQSDIDNNVPSDYHIISSDEKNFYSPSMTFNVNVAPNTDTDTINYVLKRSDTQNGYHGASDLGSITTTGNDGNNISSDTIINNVPNNYKIDGSTPSFTYSGQTHTVNVIPVDKTETIHFKLDTYDQSNPNYVISDGKNNTDLGTVSVKGQYDVAENISNLTNDIPSHYQLYNSSSNPQSATFTYDGQDHDVYVSPSQVSDLITYNIASDAPSNYVGQKQKIDNIQIQTTGTYGMQSDTSKLTQVPDNYSIRNGQSIIYDTNPHSIQVEPNQTSQTINYVLSGNNIPNNYYGKTGTLGSLTINVPYYTQYKASYLNNLGLPDHYQIVNNNQAYTDTNNEQKQDIQITPSKISENVAYNLGDTPNNYVGKTGTLGNISISGLYKTTVNNNVLTNIPQYYHIVGTPSLIYDDTPQAVEITPSKISEPIHYMMSQQNEPNEYEGKAGQLGSININGLYETTVNNSSLNNVPTYYHIIGTPSLVYDVNEHDVQIAPSNVTNTIQYQLNQPNIPNEYVGKTGQLGQTTITKPYETEVDMSDYNKIPQYYHIVDNPNLVYDNLTHIVQIVPSNVTNTIQYQLNQPNIPNEYVGKTGQLGQATITKPYETKVDMSDYNKIPQYYHIVDNPNLVYDNLAHPVQIAPSNVINTIQYQLNQPNIPNEYVGKTGQLGQTTITKPYETKVNTSDYNKIPQYYHIVDNPNLVYDNLIHPIQIAPSNVTNTIQYQLSQSNIPKEYVGKKGQLGQTTITKPYETKVDMSDYNQIPQYYHIVANPNLVYDNLVHPVQITPSKVTNSITYNVSPYDVPINYVGKTGNIGHTKITSYYDTKVNTNDLTNIPQYYHLFDNPNLIYDNQAHTAQIAPSPVINHIY